MNNAFDRTIINTRERPVSSDLNQHFSQVDFTIREMLRALHIPHSANIIDAGLSGFTPVSGFLGDAFYPVAAGGMVVNLAPGLGMLFDAAQVASGIDGVGGLNDLAAYYPVYMPAVVPITIPAAPSAGQERYDIIEVKLDRRRQDSASRDVFNATSGVFEAVSVLKTLAFILDATRVGVVGSGGSSTTGIGLKTGATAPANTALVPATTSGYTRVAIIKVDGGVSSIAQNMIQDRRRVMLPGGHATLGFSGLQTVGAPDTVVAASYPAACAGVRMAMRPLGSDAAVRCYIFAGEVADCALTAGPIWTVGTRHAYIYPTANIKATGGTPANCLLARVLPEAAAAINSSEQSLLASILPVAIGQPYLYFDVGHRTIDAGDTQPTSWNLGVVCPLTTN